MHAQLRPQLLPGAEVRRRSDGTDGIYDAATGHSFETAPDQANLVSLFDGKRSLMEISAEFMTRHGYVPFAALDDLMWGLADAGLLVAPPTGERPGIPRSSWLEMLAPTARRRWRSALPTFLRAFEVLLWPAVGTAVVVTVPRAALSPIDVPLFYLGAVLALTLRERFKAAVCALCGFPPRATQLVSMVGAFYFSPDNTITALMDRRGRVLAHFGALAGTVTALQIGWPFPGVAAGVLAVLLFDLCPMVSSSVSGILTTVSGQMNLREHVRAYVGLPLIKNLLSLRLAQTERALFISAVLSMAWMALLVVLIIALLSTGVELIDLGLKATGAMTALAWLGATAVFVVCPIPLLVGLSQLIESAFAMLWPPDGGKQLGGVGDLGVFRSIPLFSTLGDKDLAAIAAHSREVTYEAGQVIVEQGSAGNIFYSVRRGAVEVARGASSEVAKVVAQLGAGDCFGETAMLKDGVRTATVRALSRTVVIELATEAFEAVVAKVGGVDFASVLRAASTIGKSRLFRELAPERLSSLATQFVPRTVLAGVEVIRFGDPGAEFFLVAKGQVEVLAADGKKLTQLGDGDHFGEIALLRSVPRTATVRTLTDTLLLVLSRDVFLEALNADLSLSAKVEQIVASRLTDEAAVAAAPGA